MKTVLQLLFLLVAALLFTTIQSLLLRKSGRTSLTFVKEELERAGNSKTFQNLVGKKQIWLKKHGADVFLQDGILVSRWYLYKFTMAAFTESITYLPSSHIHLHKLLLPYSPFRQGWETRCSR